MKPCSRIFTLLFLPFVFLSCSNELEVLAPYEENASVVALLDPNQTWQFIKINKVFTNPDAKATDVAGIADSLYFDTLDTWITEEETGRIIPLTRANIALKDSGVFATSPNYLYVTNENITPNYRYRLNIVLPNGKRLTALTNLSYTPFVAYPVTPIQRVLTVQNTSTNSFTLQFVTPRNGKIFDAYLNFRYLEINKSDTTQKTEKSVSWRILRSFRSVSDKGNESVIYRLPGALFFEFVAGNIEVDPNVIRRFLPCEFSMIAGNLELDNYIQSSAPSIGIVQKQSEYSNIRDGIGIFASRNTYFLNNITLSEVTKNVFVNHSEYKKLGFEK